MKLENQMIHHLDAYTTHPGARPLVIAAPHHGENLGSNNDYGTGDLATALANQLNASLVVAHDLRARADVNKEPSTLPNRDAQALARRYQNLVFAADPGLVVEIHGHVRGHYDVEIGYDGDPVSGQSSYDVATRLSTFREALLAAWQAAWPPSSQLPTVGVFQFDPGVLLTGSGAFALRKQRRQRTLLGLPRFGLHIEFSARLRIGAEADTIRPSLVRGLAAALESGYGSLLEYSLQAVSPGPEIQPDSRPALPAAGPALLVVEAPSTREIESVAWLGPEQVRRLGVAEGERLAIWRDLDVIHPQVRLLAGQGNLRVGLEARLRRQLSVQPGQKVFVGGPARRLKGHLGYLSSVPVDSPAAVDLDIGWAKASLVLPASWINQDPPEKSLSVTVQAVNGPPFQATASTSPIQPASKIMISLDLLDQFGLTRGDVVDVYPSRHWWPF